ncbi:MAG TPA: hypothetical protein VMU88_03050, partial [bacterium]|nr:hypothetical protein [bacterium]
AQEIILGLDRDRISWSKKPFAFDTQAFQKMIRELDPEGKIRVVERDFHSQKNPEANDTHERNVLSMECRKGNWVIQIDADEVLLNPMEFKAWVDSGKASGMVMATWLLVFKRIGEDFLVVDKENHHIAVGSRLQNACIGFRHTGQDKCVSPLRLLHFAYGRTPEELKVKLENWSHSGDFDVERYFEMWKSVTLENYAQFKNLHPMEGKAWPKLKRIQKQADWPEGITE